MDYEEPDPISIIEVLQAFMLEEISLRTRMVGYDFSDRKEHNIVLEISTKMHEIKIGEIQLDLSSNDVRLKDRGPEISEELYRTVVKSLDYVRLPSILNGAKFHLCKAYRDIWVDGDDDQLKAKAKQLKPCDSDDDLF